MKAVVHSDPEILGGTTHRPRVPVRNLFDYLAAAALWLGKLVPGKPLILVGYSFGSRCAIAHAIADRTIAGVVAIGLPLRIWEFGDLASLHRPLAVVQGADDEFGPIDEVQALIARAAPPGRLYPVPGASHLFPGRAHDAAVRVVDAVREILQQVGGRSP